MYATLKDISRSSFWWPISYNWSLVSWWWRIFHWLDCTLQLFGEEWIFQVCPFPGSYIADAIAEMISKLLEAWNIDKAQVHAVVRDNAANMVIGVRQCWLSGVSCVIHTLQLVIKDSILVQKVIIILAQCRKILDHFKHSGLATSCVPFRNIQV